MLEFQNHLSSNIPGWEELWTMHISDTLITVRRLVTEGVPSILIPTDDGKMYRIYIPHRKTDPNEVVAIGNPEDMHILWLEVILRDKLTQNPWVFFCIQPYDDGTGLWERFLLNYVTRNPAPVVTKDGIPRYAWSASHVLQ